MYTYKISGELGRALPGVVREELIGMWPRETFPIGQRLIVGTILIIDY